MLIPTWCWVLFSGIWRGDAFKSPRTDPEREGECHLARLFPWGSEQLNSKAVLSSLKHWSLSQHPSINPVGFPSPEPNRAKGSSVCLAEICPAVLRFHFLGGG